LGGGHLSATNLLKRFYTAMDNAGIAREGEHGRKRTLHSLRHSFARVTLENGAAIDWVKGQLGHSSITLTIDTYGHWSRETQKATAKSLKGAFKV